MRFSGEDAARTDTIYVSRSIGKDKATCGPQQFPCYSISQAIRVSQWSDQIYIDSTNSKSNPYNCSTVSSPWIHVNKSLSFSGYPFMAHLACQAGFYFDGQKQHPTAYRIHKTLFHVHQVNVRVFLGENVKLFYPT